MNDHRPDLDPDDDALDLARAYLDDELTPAGRATVEASPELLDLIADLRWASELVADLSPGAEHPGDAGAAVDPMIDVAIGAALDVFDREVAPAIAARHHTEVIHITASRRWQRRGTTLLAAAAGLLLVGVVAASIGGTSSNDMASTGAAKVADQRMAADDAATALPSAESAPVGGGAAATVVTIDTIIGPASVPSVLTDPAELLELAGQVLGPEWLSGTITAPPADLDLFGCTPTLSPDQLVIATITWIDQPALAVANLAAGSVSAIDLGCNVLAEATYAG